MQNAREFIDQVASILRAKGREVVITETQESFGTFVWMQATGPRWFDYTISLHARHSTSTGRWALGEMKIDRAGIAHPIFKINRQQIVIAADVYA